MWHSSLAKQDSKDIERVQKAACKVILKEYYEDYDKALKLLRLEKLKDRRQNLCLNFAKNCLKNKKAQSIFPVKTCNRILRNQNKYLVKFAANERYKKSTVPYLQNILNEDEKQKAKLVRFKGL